jgi:hypothetical protein
LLVSPLPQRAQSVDMLLRFREAIGAFPEQPAQRRETASTPGEEAFGAAWRPPLGDDSFNHGRGAGSVYSQIRSGRFLDADAQVSLSVAGRAAAASTPTPSLPTVTP